MESEGRIFRIGRFSIDQMVDAKKWTVTAMSKWLYRKSGSEFGPVSTTELKSLAASGEISKSDKIWREGLKSWVSAGDVNGLFVETAAAQVATFVCSICGNEFQKDDITFDNGVQTCNLCLIAKSTPSVASPSPEALRKTNAVVLDYSNRKHERTRSHLDRAFHFYWICGAVTAAIVIWAFTSLSRDIMIARVFGSFSGNLIGAIVAMLAFGAISLLAWCIFMFNCWKLVQPSERATPEKAVGFMFIPGFNFYWAFVAIFGLAKEFNQALANQGQKGRIITEELALGVCILFCLSSILVNVTPLVHIGAIVSDIVLLNEFRVAARSLIRTRD